MSDAAQPDLRAYYEAFASQLKELDAQLRELKAELRSCSRPTTGRARSLQSNSNSFPLGSKRRMTSNSSECCWTCTSSISSRLSGARNRSDLTGKTNGWKTILNTLTVHYGDRIAANTIN